MKTTRLSTLLLLLVSFIPAIQGEELPIVKPEAVGLSAEKLGRIAPALQAFVDDQKVAGAMVVVARRGKVAYVKACGMQDVAAGKAMQTDTIFRIYSMTKPITSVAAMMLWEEGRFKLDDPVSRFLPEFKDVKVHAAESKEGEDEKPPKKPAREMTLRDLMRHTSGLTYGFFGNTPVDKMYRAKSVFDWRGSLGDMVSKLGEIPLLYEPGTRFNYSVSTDVLGRVVEVISGKSLAEFFQERIFKPLDMKDTGFHVPPEKLDRFATNYGPDGKGGLRVTDAPAKSRYRTSPTMRSGGGGLVSTARDYTRFCQMLASGGTLGGRRLLREKTVREMTRNQLPPAAMPVQMSGFKRQGLGFGLGFSVRVKKSLLESAAAVGEYGWGGAASTHFWISPAHDLVVVALQQHQPYSARLENTLKPMIYDAIVD